MSCWTVHPCCSTRFWLGLGLGLATLTLTLTLTLALTLINLVVTEGRVAHERHQDARASAALGLG